MFVTARLCCTRLLLVIGQCTVVDCHCAAQRCLSEEHETNLDYYFWFFFSRVISDRFLSVWCWAYCVVQNSHSDSCVYRYFLLTICETLQTLSSGIQKVDWFPVGGLEEEDLAVFIDSHDVLRTLQSTAFSKKPVCKNILFSTSRSSFIISAGWTSFWCMNMYEVMIEHQICFTKHSWHHNTLLFLVALNFICFLWLKTDCRAHGHKTASACEVVVLS